jgi:hypothetical protein
MPSLRLKFGWVGSTTGNPTTIANLHWRLAIDFEYNVTPFHKVLADECMPEIL